MSGHPTVSAPRWFAVVLLVLVGSGCDQFHDPPPLPELRDWIDCGTVLGPGEAGDWDAILWGGFAGSIMKQEGRYLLYYQGSDGYHTTEHTVTHRSVGLAESTDGFNFTKHPDNPVLRFSPNGQHEEGAVSTAPLADAEGRVIMYYGANTWAGGEEVNADARVAIAADGIRFQDHGVVLDRSDPTVWGGGDEVFPIVAARSGDRVAIYYIPNGTPQREQLGVAWTDGSGGWRTAPVREGRRAIHAWGPGSVAPLASGDYVLFLSFDRGGPSYLEARIVSSRRPDRTGSVVRRYQWDGLVPQFVLHDPGEARWLLYYRDSEHLRYGLMVAAGLGADPPREPCPPSRFD
jgi:hypothetical protein